MNDGSSDPLEGIGWSRVPTDEYERIQRIIAELRVGFEKLSDIEPAVAFFGSARSTEGCSEYELARDVARSVARAGFDILTGGGSGVMEAANRGGREGGGVSIGLNIRLSREQAVDRYVDRTCEFRYF